MRSIRRTTIGLTLAVVLSATACPGNEDDADTSPAPQSGATGATGGVVDGEVTGG